MDSNRIEYGYHVQRSLRRICELSARSTTDSAPGGRHLYLRFGDIAVCSGLLADALSDGDCRPFVGDVLFTDTHLRFDDAAQTADYLWHRGICSGHRVRKQYRNFDGGMVHRTSLLGLDLLDCRGCDPSDVSLHLFRNSTAAAGRSGSKLARIRLLQCFACSYLRRAGSRRASRLAQFWRDHRYALRRSPPVNSGLSSTVAGAESHVEPFVLEQPEHGAPGLRNFCVQVRAPFSAGSRPGIPEHDSGLSATRNRARSGL